MCQGTGEPVCFKLGMMLNTTELCSLIPVWMTLIFTQVTGLLESSNLCSHSVLLHLLCSQLYLWSSPFLVRFLSMSLFFNPIIEVATFRLRGWCMLDVFLLPAFTGLGHECQDLWSLWDGMHLCTDWTSVYTLIQESFGGRESESMLTPMEMSPLLEAQMRFEPAMLHHAGQQAQHTTDWAILGPPLCS